MTVKTLIRTLAISLCLLLVVASPVAAREAPFESLPIGAKARLGRGWITNAQYSPDGTRLAVGSSAGIWLYDTQTYETTSLLTGHTGAVVNVAFSPDGRTLASAGWGLGTFLWDVATGSLQYTLDNESYAWRVAFSPDGRTLASATSDDTQLWDTNTGALRHTLTGYSGSLWSVAFSPDGRTLTNSGYDSTVHLWDTNTGTLRHKLRGHSDSVWSVAFSPDGRTLASGSHDHTVRLWDVATGSLRHILEGHTGRVRFVAFSPDGRTLASGSWDGTILLWDVVSEAAAGDFRNLATNPNGHWAVWKSGTTVTVRFSSPRAPVQYHARQDPQPQFVLPEGFRPATRVTHTVTGTPVHADGTPVPNASPATFDLTIDPNGEVRYLDNAKVDELGYVAYCVTHLTWQTGEPPSTFGTQASPTVDSDASN